MRKCQGCNEIKKKILGLLYLTHCVKYPEMQAFSDPFLPVYGQNCDSVHTRKNTDQKKPIFRDTSRTVKVKNFIRSSTLIRRW